jgi:hypothetical protein
VPDSPPVSTARATCICKSRVALGGRHTGRDDPEGPQHGRLEARARREGPADRMAFTGWGEDAPAFVTSEETGMNDAIADRREALLVPLATRERRRSEEEFTAARMIERDQALSVEVADRSQ